MAVPFNLSYKLNKECYLTQRSFSQSDQIDFAKLSGDYNPVHLDPLKARRMHCGQTIVHGSHALLWALDTLCSQKSSLLKLVSLKTSFNQFIGVGQTVQFNLKAKDETSAEIQLISGNQQAARIIVVFSSSVNEECLSFPDLNPAHGECLDRTTEQLNKVSGSIDLCLSQNETACRFPSLMRVFPSSQIAELMSLTRLLGMECPGLHSMFSDLNLEFSNPCEKNSRLNYQVLSHDPRIGLLTVAVQAPGMKGTLRAFARPSPQSQGAYLELSKLVQKDEFSDQIALIIGGSRGLGEVTSKLLAAGGARVVITYCLGSHEAQSIVEQIKKEGGSAKCFAYDVLDPKSLRKKDLKSEWAPTHLYYFATPVISMGLRSSFSLSLFQKFCDYYVAGFFNTFQIVQRVGQELNGIFYPSTVFIDDLPSNMAEYVAAKSAGESICALLHKKSPSMNIFKPRLPKAATDQTASLLPTDKKDPALLMLEKLRQFQAKGKV